MHQVRLKPGKEKAITRRHPWIFSGAVQQADKNIKPGEPVHIISADGNYLATGTYSNHSQIRIRILSYSASESIDAMFFQERINRALKLRKRFVQNTNSCRIIFAESDQLPGLIVDRYADYLVCQFLSAGMEYFKNFIVDQLEAICRPRGIFERSDTDSRQKEGMKPCIGLLRGNEPPELIEVNQDGLSFLVNVRSGHKTGMYLDQRENRNLIAGLSQNMEVLNCFSYTGGFSLAALQVGAKHVINIESSVAANELYLKQLELNGLSAEKTETVAADVFSTLREYQKSGQQFDLIILDPPKFISSAQQITRGCRGYKDINMQAMKLLKSGGILVTFSCSGHLSPELFQKVVADAAVDAGCSVRILSYLGQPPDHAVTLEFPEGRYLKGLVCYKS